MADSNEIKMNDKIKVLLVRPKFSSIIVNLEPLGLEYVAGIAGTWISSVKYLMSFNIRMDLGLAD